MTNNLDQKDITFAVSRTDISKIERKNNFCINVFCYKNDLVYHVHISKEKIENSMDLYSNYGLTKLFINHGFMSISKI